MQIKGVARALLFYESDGQARSRARGVFDADRSKLKGMWKMWELDTSGLLGFS